MDSLVMRLTVLSNSSRYLMPVGAGASYVLEVGGRRLLLDVAAGVETRLAQRLGGARLDAVVVSHVHEDMVTDAAQALAALAPGGPLVVPAVGEPRFTKLLKRASRNLGLPFHPLVLPAAAGGSLEIAGARLAFGPASHGCPGFSLRVEAAGRVLAYLSDTGALPAHAEVAREADLLVAHALLHDEESEGPAGATNLSAEAAARLAHAAGARRLALGHVPLSRAGEAPLDGARRRFPGEIVLLEEFKTYPV